MVCVSKVCERNSLENRQKKHHLQCQSMFFLLQEYNEYYIHTVKDVIILNAVKTGIFHFTNKAYQEQCMESFQALHHDST